MPRNALQTRCRAETLAIYYYEQFKKKRIYIFLLTDFIINTKYCEYFSLAAEFVNKITEIAEPSLLPQDKSLSRWITKKLYQINM